MSTNPKQDSENQEIDLTMLSDKVGVFFQGISSFLFNTIQFVLRKIVIIGILFIVGVGSGVYLDTTNKSYDHEIIVQPNFGSTDYLYAKIAVLESKIKERDTVFLKSIGIKEPSKLAKIEVKPIVDVYKFISTSEQNFELLKLMSEDSDIKKIVEDKPTSKNYIYHLISFKTKERITAKNVVEPILNYLNSSTYFEKIQKEFINNEQLKIKSNEITISQIDGFLNSFSNTVNGNSKSDKLVYYNENTQLNDVIVTKNRLVQEQGNLRIEMVGLDKIIKENSSTMNTESTESLNGKLKLILPLLFIFIYVLLYCFGSFYRKQALIKKQSL